MKLFDKFVISSTEPDNTQVLWVVAKSRKENPPIKAFVDGRWQSLGATPDLSNYLTKDALNDYYTKLQTDSILSRKLDNPVQTGTAGQILKLNSNGKTEWATAPEGSVMDSDMSDESENPVKNKAIKAYVDSIIYDISVNHPTAGPSNDGKFTLEYILDQNNVDTLIPTAVRKGGMSIRFIQSSDNEYVQYRYMSSSTAVADFTNVANWQGVDNEPTAGSDNLVKSDGVSEIVSISYKEADKVLAGYITSQNGDNPDGKLISSQNYTTYVFKIRPSFNKITTHCFASSNHVYGISFFTSDEIGSSTYIQGSGILIPIGEINLSTTSIPSNAKVVAISSRTDNLPDDTTVCILSHIQTDIKDFVATSETVGDLDEQINGVYKQINAGYTGTSSWAFQYPDQNHLVFRVNPGDTVSITKNSSTSTYYYVLRTYTKPVDNSSPIDFSSVISERQSVSSIVEFTVPQDTHYIVVSGMSNGVDHFASQILINGININVFDNNISYKISQLEQTVDEVDAETGSSLYLRYTDADKELNAYITCGVNGTDDGSLINSPSFSAFVFRISDTFKRISAHCFTVSTSKYGIAFYSDFNNLNGSTFISGVEITSTENHLVANTIPPNAVAVVISTRSASQAPDESTVKISVNVASEVYKEDNSICKFNEDIDYIVKSSSAFIGKDYSKIEHKYLTMLHGSDFHGDTEDFKRMIEYARYYNNYFQAVLVTGDTCSDSFEENGFEDSYGAFYNKAVIPVLFNVGNHEVGKPQNKVSSYDGYTNTNEGIAARYITPFMSFNGCVQPTGKAYYYKDFSAYKIRLISLYEYEMPRILDPQDNTLYKYDLWQRYFSQDQIDWLISCLQGLSSGWSVVITMHDVPDVITKIESKFTSPIYPNAEAPILVQGNILQEIIDAYISKTTLFKTYTNTRGYDTTEVPDVTVNTDFGSANGSFICYLVGHSHLDAIGRSSAATNKQLVIVMTTSGRTKQFYDDIYRVTGCKSQDCLNMYIFDTDTHKIRILRIGANSTLNMDYRDMMSISYAQE